MITKTLALAVLAASICLSGAAPALAGSGAPVLPRYDVERHCDKVARFSGSFSQATKNGCFALEQSAYDALKAAWPDLPAEMKSHCRQVAEFAGDPAYTTLSGCVRLEMRAARKPNTFEY